MKHYLKHALSCGELKRVIIGLDFFAFNCSIKNKDDFNLSILKNGKSDSVIKKIKCYFFQIKSAYSFNCVKDSVLTLRSQKVKFLEYLSNGQRSPLFQQAKVIKGGGNRPYFESIMKSYIKNFSEEFFLYNGVGQNSLVDFEEIIKISTKNDLELYLYIPPNHALLLEIIKVCGKWNLYEEWKESLVGIINEKGNNKTYLWDFSGFNFVTCEGIPKNKKEKLMKYHWEPSHYSHKAGDLVLDVMLKQKEVEGFGTLLNNCDMKNHLQKIRKNSGSFRVKFKDEIFYINKIYNSLK